MGKVRCELSEVRYKLDVGFAVSRPRYGARKKGPCSQLNRVIKRKQPWCIPADGALMSSDGH